MPEKVIIGNAELWHGDCREVLPLPSVSLVIADPPYGIGESSRRNATRVKPLRSRRDAKNTRGTYVAPRDYGHYSWDSFAPEHDELRLVIEAGEKCIVWGGNHFGMPSAPKWLVWDKMNSGDFADCELAWTNLPGAIRIFRHMWNGMLRDSERDTPRVHPTQKPIALMAWCIKQAGKPTSIGEPYMGSAPAGCAAAMLGIPYWGIERERRYFDIACERISRAQAQGKLFEPEQPPPKQGTFL